VSNGITFAPDFVSGVDCRAAGHVHDWHYWLGGTEKDRELADYRLYRNLVHSELSRFMAGIFFRRVRLVPWITSATTIRRAAGQSSGWCCGVSSPAI